MKARYARRIRTGIMFAKIGEELQKAGDISGYVNCYLRSRELRNFTLMAYWRTCKRAFERRDKAINDALVREEAASFVGFCRDPACSSCGKTGKSAYRPPAGESGLPPEVEQLVRSCGIELTAWQEGLVRAAEEAWNSACGFDEGLADAVRVVAEQVRAQTLNEVAEVVRTADGFRRWIDDSRVIDEGSLLDGLAALRGKESSHG